MNIDVAQVQQFHGHMCPGLAIGIRVAEKAMEEMGGRPEDEEMVSLVETNNCAVDAIQFITGCTFGKGNLIHLDYGKNAFRFIRRRDGKAIRILVRPDLGKPVDPDEAQHLKRMREGNPSQEDIQKSRKIRQARTELILSAPLDDVVEVQPLEMEIPSHARIYNSVACDDCGEMTMEIRLRMLEGKKYCPECLEKVLSSNQKAAL